jgi:hypothetical protein
MNETERLKRRESPIVRTTVVSEEGAAIRVERIEVSEQMKRNLTTSVSSIGSPRRRAGTRAGD